MAQKINFTARDYQANQDAIIEFIQREAPELWNSYYQGDLGKVLLDAIAYFGAVDSYVIDAQALESFVGTLRLRESAINQAALKGYKIRGATAASLEAYCRATTAPVAPNVFLIRKGTVVRAAGLPWEVSKDYYVQPNSYSPIRTIIQYGDVKGVQISDSGVSTQVNACVSIRQGSSQAILTNIEGTRFSTETGFGALVSQGCILKLTSTYRNGSFGAPPDITRDEFAIIDIGQQEFDQYDRSVLFLDRVWDQDYDFIGKWTIENRSIELIQGETHVEEFVAPIDADSRAKLSLNGAFYPVLGGNPEAFVKSGFFGNATENGESGGDINTGISVQINGTKWIETGSLLFENPDSRAYEVRFDELDRVTVIFGDGRFGAMVPAGAAIQIQYRVGGGSRGNISQGTFEAYIPAISSDSGGSILATNPYSVGRGGQDRETLQDIKQNLQKFIRTNDRAVGELDYDYLASNFTDTLSGRIKLAKSVLHKNTVPREQNIVWLYCWVEGINGQLTAPNSTLKRKLSEYMEKRKMICDEVVIIDGVTDNVPLSFRYKYGGAHDPVKVEEAIRSAVNGTFKRLLPGQDLHIADLYEAVAGVDGVDWVTFYYPIENLPARSSYRLMVNSIQPGTLTRLITPAAKSGTVVNVANPALFTPGSLISIFQLHRKPSCCIVESITDNTLTLRTAIEDSYSESAAVFNTDWAPVGWQYEKKVDVYIRYTTGSGSVLAVSEQVKRVISDYFSQVILPEEYLSRATLLSLITAISGVSTASINLGTMDAATSQITATAREKVSLGRLIINGVDF